MNRAQEGKAQVFVEEQNVFYNPIQEFSRDLSVLAIREFQRMKKEESMDIMVIILGHSFEWFFANQEKRE